MPGVCEPRRGGERRRLHGRICVLVRDVGGQGFAFNELLDTLEVAIPSRDPDVLRGSCHCELEDDCDEKSAAVAITIAVRSKIMNPPKREFRRRRRSPHKIAPRTAQAAPAVRELAAAARDAERVCLGKFWSAFCAGIPLLGRLCPSFIANIIDSSDRRRRRRRRAARQLSCSRQRHHRPPRRS